MKGIAVYVNDKDEVQLRGKERLNQLIENNKSLQNLRKIEFAKLKKTNSKNSQQKHIKYSMVLPEIDNKQQQNQIEDESSEISYLLEELSDQNSFSNGSDSIQQITEKPPLKIKIESPISKSKEKVKEDQEILSGTLPSKEQSIKHEDSQSQYNKRRLGVRLLETMAGNNKESSVNSRSQYGLNAINKLLNMTPGQKFRSFMQTKLDQLQKEKKQVRYLIKDGIQVSSISIEDLAQEQNADQIDSTDEEELQFNFQYISENKKQERDSKLVKKSVKSFRKLQDNRRIIKMKDKLLLFYEIVGLSVKEQIKQIRQNENDGESSLSDVRKKMPAYYIDSIMNDLSQVRFLH